MGPFSEIAMLYKKAKRSRISYLPCQKIAENLPDGSIYLNVVLMQYFVSNVRKKSIYYFQLGSGYEEMSISDIMERDRAGEFPRILHNPMYKDTLTVHGKGGYSIIRFKATNPGEVFVI